MSLLRRRLMMQTIGGGFINYLDGYQLPQTENDAYGMKSEWLDERTVQLRGGSHFGAPYGARIFAGKPADTSGRNALAWASSGANEIIPSFEAGKNYRLTMTVKSITNAGTTGDRLDIGVAKNTSTCVSSSFALGTIAVGDQIELRFSGNGWKCLLQGQSGTSQYVIDFDVMIEEVS